MSASSVEADLAEVLVRRIAVSPMDNNVYLLTATGTGAQVLIDAADDPFAIAGLIEEAKADAAVPAHVDAIVTTHSHPDHIRALADLVGRTGAMTVAGAADASQIEAATGVTVARRVDDGDRVEVPGLSLDVISLRGHTAGSIALALTRPGFPAHLFTGDTLFPGGLGATNHDPARFNQLFTDVKQRLFDRFDDDAVVHPGHGRPTTLGVERPSLRQWFARGW